MRTALRRHLSYANVVATMALVFAMGGTAIATKHYLISSTKQIKPSVLKKLDGKTGPAGKIGAPGKEGPAGKEGAKGERGEPGPLLSTLPPGKTETGAYGFASTRFKKEGGAYEPATETSYPIPLAFTPRINIVKEKASPTAACPGSPGKPAATAGNLCVYAEREDVELKILNEPAEGHFGFFAYFGASEGADYEDHGTWAVTAP
jgi:hypothetical protein